MGLKRKYFWLDIQTTLNQHNRARLLIVRWSQFANWFFGGSQKEKEDKLESVQCEELKSLLRDAIQFFSLTHSSSRRLKLQVASRMTTSSSTVCCVVCYSWDVGGVETSFFGHAQDYRLSQQSALPCAGEVVLCLYSFYFSFIFQVDGDIESYMVRFYSAHVCIG